MFLFCTLAASEKDKLFTIGINLSHFAYTHARTHTHLIKTRRRVNDAKQTFWYVF